MKIFLRALIVISILALASPTLASTLYALDSNGAPGVIYTLNQSTGAETLVGPVGPAFTFPGDLASDINPGTFRIWAPDINSNTLIKIDPNTGLGTPVAPQSIFDIATRPEDGTTFAVNAFTNELYKLDLNTGATTLVGPHTTPTHNMVGLAFGPVPEPTTFTLLAFGAAFAAF